jgi:hypothetical protein
LGEYNWREQQQKTAHQDCFVHISSLFFELMANLLQDGGGKLTLRAADRDAWKINKAKAFVNWAGLFGRKAQGRASGGFVQSGLTLPLKSQMSSILNDRKPPALIKQRTALVRKVALVHKVRRLAAKGYWPRNW